MIPHKLHLPELNLAWPKDLLGPKQFSGSNIVLGQCLPCSLVVVSWKEAQAGPLEDEGLCEPSQL